MTDTWLKIEEMFFDDKREKGEVYRSWEGNRMFKIDRSLLKGNIRDGDVFYLLIPTTRGGSMANDGGSVVRVEYHRSFVMTGENAPDTYDKDRNFVEIWVPHCSKLFRGRATPEELAIELGLECQDIPVAKFDSKDIEKNFDIQNEFVGSIETLPVRYGDQGFKFILNAPEP